MPSLFCPFVVFCHLKSLLPFQMEMLLYRVRVLAQLFLVWVTYSTHSVPVGKVVRNQTAAVKHERYIGYEGSCVSYSPRLAQVCGLMQGPKKDHHCSSSPRRGWGRWWSTGYLSKRNSTSVTRRLLCDWLVVNFNVYVYRDMGITLASPNRAA